MARSYPVKVDHARLRIRVVLRNQEPVKRAPDRYVFDTLDEIGPVPESADFWGPVESLSKDKAIGIVFGSILDFTNIDVSGGVNGYCVSCADMIVCNYSGVV